MQTYLIFLTFATKIKNMNGIYILLTILVYFSLLLVVAKLTSKRADNDAFFRGFNMNITGVFAHGLLEDHVHELNNRTFVVACCAIENIFDFFGFFFIAGEVNISLFWSLSCTNSLNSI